MTVFANLCFVNMSSTFIPKFIFDHDSRERSVGDIQENFSSKNFAFLNM